jgi:hypothetical protein
MAIKCEKCHSSFKRKSGFLSHMRKHKREDEATDENVIINGKEEATDEKTIKPKIKNTRQVPIKNVNTFIDLYNFLQNYPDNNIEPWLNQSWRGKDKQESLLRLFAGLGLIPKINCFTICSGNYNKKTIIKHETIKDVFYDGKNKPINLKDKGDSSDLTGIDKTDSKHLLVTTSKNLNKIQVGKLDIDKILTNFEQYEKDGYKKTLCVCIRSIRDFQTMVKGIENTNKQLKSTLESNDTITIDWDDLNEAYNQFKLYFSQKPLKSIITANKTPLSLKLHQHLGVLKTMRLKNCGKKTVLWGHIQRSGKSYIIGGCIMDDSKDKDECNYLIITTAPNETIEQYCAVFEHSQFDDFNIVVLNDRKTKPKFTKQNIIVCSKQFLQIDHTKGHDKKKHIDLKPKNINWLKKIAFDMRFVDESHNGGTTALAQKVLNWYGGKAFTVQITATYAKPSKDYKIPREDWILWDLEDIKLCKNITDENNITRLVKKHGDVFGDVIRRYSLDNIIAEYSKYPELWLLTDEIKTEVKDEVLKNTKNNNYGWSPDACFLLKQGVGKDKKVEYKAEFQNEAENLKMWYRIFGKTDKLGIPDDDYPDGMVFMKRIKQICQNPEVDMRFIGEGGFYNEPMVIMAFLPQNNINKISDATINLLEKHNVVPDYEIVKINTKATGGNPKQHIEDARIKARISGKKGVLVLSGKQCSLGVTINNCDIVLLLNNNTSFDLIYQMMFRCMTEGDNKKCGFVVDLNIHRTIQNAVIEYGSLLKPNKHPGKVIKFILQERIVNLNGDHWMPTFGNDVSKITALCKNAYEIYQSKIRGALDHFLKRLSFKHILLTQNEQKVLNALFGNFKEKPEHKEVIENSIKELADGETADDKIKEGIEQIKVEVEAGAEADADADNKPEEEPVNYMDILRRIIPLICILTIHDEKSSFNEMIEFINTHPDSYQILIDQTKSWWGKAINDDVIKAFINIYTKYMRDDKETNQIIRTVKELFQKNITNHRELSKLIDVYLIPHSNEKKENAEVSTPFELRQEMLDKIPEDFWKSPKKVFEPCAGKGGFVIDIIDRFMIGLEKTIPNEKKRYKTIVEECLYFSDINPTNLFICKLLIDPYNEYKLNYNEGDTLKLDIKEKWDVDGFDAVIGNPPYNSSGDTGTGNTIWQDFTKVSLNKLLQNNGYLLYVHPPGWRKPNTERGKFYGLYKLMTQDNQMIYLSIHGIKDGQKTFNCGTRYDWYLIERKQTYTTTIVNDEKNNNIVMDMNNFDWLPNYNIDTIQNILAKEDEEKCPIIYNRSNYGSDKKYTQKDKTDKFKYPIIHTIPKSGIRYIYSNCNDKSHFGVSKVIFGDNGLNNAIIDMDGEYGMSENSMAIEVSSIEEANEVKQCLLNDKFKMFMKSCIIGNFRIDWRLFTYFKKDFWKEFI